METLLSVIAIISLVGVLSSLAGRLFVRKQGALWLWGKSTAIGWTLIVVGTALILLAFVVDREGPGMSTKLGFGSLLLIAGTWMIW